MYTLLSICSFEAYSMNHGVLRKKRGTRCGEEEDGSWMVGYCGTYIRNKHSRFDGLLYCLGIHADTWNTKRVLSDLSLIHLLPMAPPLREEWVEREAGEGEKQENCYIISQLDC